MEECKEKGIPEHLWQKDRENVINFEENEHLYRRFRSSIPDSFDKDTEQLKTFSGEIFQIKNDSYNRSSFCHTFTDVLYNDEGEYKDSNGVFSIKATDVFFEFDIKIDDNVKKVEVYAKHDCLRCNYPHSILQYKVDGEIPDHPKPGRQIKDAVRKRLFPRISILKISS